MQIDESRKLLLSDTMVPDIFILEYLSELSGLAVKIYLFLLMTARTNRSITEQDLSRRLGENNDLIKTALLELAQAELLTISGRSIELTDIKAKEIERTYRVRTSSELAENGETDPRFAKREKLLTDISRTFFQGLMSPSWYREIDNWFDRYGFEPEVIYALFQECARRNKLDSKAYITAVAENWHKRGIISFNDLNQYFLDHEKVRKVSRKVSRKLRKNMTEYDDEMVARWVEQLGYDFDVIDLALRKTTKLSHPNLSFIDRILQEWFEHQLHDVEAIKVYEQEKAARLAKERQTESKGDAGNKSAGKGLANFEQRSYSKEYLNGFYETIDADETESKESEKAVEDQCEPQQMDLADWVKRAAGIEEEKEKEAIHDSSKEDSGREE